MEKLLPLKSKGPESRHHGTRLRLVDADDYTNDRKGAFASDQNGRMNGQAMGAGGMSFSPFPIDMRSFFGGSFFA